MLKNILVLVVIIVGGAALGVVSMKIVGAGVPTNDDGPIGCPPRSEWCSITDEKNSTTLYHDRIEVKSNFGDRTIFLKEIDKLTRNVLTVRVFSKDRSSIELRFALLLDAQRFEQLVEEKL